MYNLAGGRFVDGIAQGVANVFGDANNVANLFTGVLGICGFDGAEVDAFKEGEAEEDAGVDGEASEGGEGNVLDGIIPEMIEKEAGVKKGMEPELGRSTGAVHDAVGSVFDKLDTPLSRVLPLTEWFTAPVGNGEDAHEVKGSTVDLHLFAVREELAGTTTEADIVFQGVDKFFGARHGVDVSDIGLHANEQLCFSDTTINGGDRGDDAVRGHSFTTGQDIQHGVGCLEGLLEFGANRETSKLSGVL